VTRPRAKSALVELSDSILEATRMTVHFPSLFLDLDLDFVIAGACFNSLAATKIQEVSSTNQHFD
jgi:hypothetical protein